MRFSSLVLLLLIVTFLPFHEGIIARSPAWKRLADAIDLGLFKPLTWRLNGGVTAELALLERHFRMASVIAAMVLAAALLSLPSPRFFVWASLAFFFCFFSWCAFRWSFRHTEHLRHAAPVFGYSLLVPWAFLLIEYAPGMAGPLRSYAADLWFVKYLSYTPLQIAEKLFLLFAGILVGYFVVLWLIFVPFAYIVLVGLKASRAGAAAVARLTRRNLLFEISAVVQVAGLVYLFWLGRHG